MEYIFHTPSPLGPITLSSDGEALTGLWFDGQTYFGATLSPDPVQKALPVFDRTLAWLEAYFSGRAPDFTPTLRPKATPFRRAVWDVLLTIPFGHTMTYGQIAAQLAQQQGATISAQAVGGAVGHNPISLIIPCHRVVGSNGSLTGYAGGLQKKLRLLQLEGTDTGPFFLPQTEPVL